MSDRVLGLKVYGFAFTHAHVFIIHSKYHHLRSTTPYQILTKVANRFSYRARQRTIVYRAYLNSLDVHSIKQ